MRLEAEANAGFSCQCRTVPLPESGAAVEYSADLNGFGTFRFTQSSLNGKALERSVSGFFPIYSYRLVDESFFNGFYGMVLDSISNGVLPDIKGEDGQSVRNESLGISQSEFFSSDEASDFLVSVLMFVLDGRETLYFSDSSRNCRIWLRALLSSLPVCLANRLSYCLATNASVPSDRKFDIVFIEGGNKDLILELRGMNRTVAVGNALYFPSQAALSPYREYFLAIRERREALFSFNDFLQASSYRKLGHELADAFDMFSYLFRTDSAFWRHESLLVHLDFYYKSFADHESSERLAIEVLDFFISSYGDPVDEEFIRGYVQLLDDRNLRLFLAAAVRKRKKSSAFALLFDIISDFIFSFSKRKFIPADIRLLLIQYAEEINREPNNVRLIDFINGISEFSKVQLKDALIEMRNEKFDYYAIRYFNSISLLSPLVEEVISFDDLECDALFLSTFFPSSARPGLQEEFSRMFFERLIVKLKPDGIAKIRAEAGGIFRIMRADGFLFSDDENFDKSSRLRVLQKSLFKALRQTMRPFFARYVLSGATCSSGLLSIWEKVAGFFGFRQ